MEHKFMVTACGFSIDITIPMLQNTIPTSCLLNADLLDSSDVTSSWLLRWNEGDVRFAFPLSDTFKFWDPAAVVWVYWSCASKNLSTFIFDCFKCTHAIIWKIFRWVEYVKNAF